MGAELGAVLHTIDPALVPNDRILDMLSAEYRQLSHHQARMATMLAELARSPGTAAPGQVVRSATPDRFAPDETRIFDQYLAGLTPEQIDKICLVAVPRAPSLTTGQLAHLLRRMVIAVDPDAAARWYRKGVRERDVTAYPAADGTITISANGLPADEAEAACERIQQLAAAAKRAGHPGLIGQIRCDLFLGLLDGRFHGMTTAQVIAALIRDYRPAGPAESAGPAEASSETKPAGATGSGRPDPDDPDDGGPDDGAPYSNGLDDSGPGDSGPGDSGPGDSGPGDSGPGDSGSRDCGPGHSSAVHSGPDDRGTDGRGLDDSGTDHGGPRHPAPSPAANPADQRVGIEIRIGLATLLGLDEHPAEIPGLGLLIAPDARLRVALQSRAEWRFAVTDTDGTLMSEGRTRRRSADARRDRPRGGVVELHVPATLLYELSADPSLCGSWAAVVADIAAQHADRKRHTADLDAHPGARLPGAALRRHTEIRDRTCTFAGVCRRPARAAEMDHSHDHAYGGTTERINIGPLCDHDHDVKHRAGWTVTQPEPGTFVWRSPLGGEYVARGEFLLPELPDPAPADPGPWPERTSRIVEGPILPRPPPEPDPPPTPTPAPPQRLPGQATVLNGPLNPPRRGEVDRE